MSFVSINSLFRKIVLSLKFTDFKYIVFQTCSDIGAIEDNSLDDISLSDIQILSNSRILLSYWKISVSRTNINYKQLSKINVCVYVSRTIALHATLMACS